VTRIFRYLSQASVDSDPLVVKYMQEQNGILMGIITRYRSQDGKSILDTQTVSIEGNKTQATFKLVPMVGTAAEGVASQNSSSPRPPSDPAPDPDEGGAGGPTRGLGAATQATLAPRPLRADDESTDSSGFWEPSPTVGVAAAATNIGRLGNGGDSDSTSVSSSNSNLSTNQLPSPYPASDGDEDEDEDEDEASPDQVSPDQASPSPGLACPDQAAPDQASANEGTTPGGPLVTTYMPPRTGIPLVVIAASHLKGHFFGVWSNSVVRGTEFLRFGLTIRHF
jgi:hypothetical protein